MLPAHWSETIVLRITEYIRHVIGYLVIIREKRGQTQYASTRSHTSTQRSRTRTVYRGATAKPSIARPYILSQGSSAVGTLGQLYRLPNPSARLTSWELCKSAPSPADASLRFVSLRAGVLTWSDGTTRVWVSKRFSRGLFSTHGGAACPILRYHAFQPSTISRGANYPKQYWALMTRCFRVSNVAY